MKRYKLIVPLALMIALVFSLFDIEVSLEANTHLKPQSYLVSNIEDTHLQLNKDLDRLELANRIFLNMTKVIKYAIYPATHEILFSGEFKLTNSIFHLTIYENKKNLKIEDWIRTMYPPFIFNEDNFSRDFYAKRDFKISNDLYAAVVKVKGEHYVNYLVQSEHNIIVLSLQLGLFQEEDLNDIIEAVNGKNELIKMSVVDLQTNLRENIQDVNALNDISIISLNFTPRKINADTSTYYLPWAKGDSYLVTQDWGVNDDPPCTEQNASQLGCSHYGLSGYAYDFGLPENTNVLASTSGTVTYLHSGETACGNFNYISYANYIVISHEDGKATNYFHLASTDVSINDKVIGGQVIGKSGKTGYTNCGAHLHFQKQAQGGAYTQSEAFYFAEYPDVTQGELVYLTTPISQNEIYANCTVKTNWVTNGPNTIASDDCILVNPESTINSSGGITVLYSY